MAHLAAIATAVATAAALGGAGGWTATPPPGGHLPVVCESQTLQDDDERLRVTLLDIVDPAGPEDDLLGPEEGDRLVSVQFRLENVGAEPYAETPVFQTEVIDTDRQHFEATVGESDAGPHFPAGTLELSPGDSALGYVSYEVPDDADLDTVRFEVGFLGLGDGDHQAEWDITEPPPEDGCEEGGPAGSP